MATPTPPCREAGGDSLLPNLHAPFQSLLARERFGFSLRTFEFAFPKI